MSDKTLLQEFIGIDEKGQERYIVAKVVNSPYKKGSKYTDRDGKEWTVDTVYRAPYKHDMFISYPNEWQDKNKQRENEVF
jgi:hypothetical protein